MDLKALSEVLFKAKEEASKIFLLVWVKKEWNTSLVSKAKKYVARILTVKNQIRNK